MRWNFTSMGRSALSMLMTLCQCIGKTNCSTQVALKAAFCPSSPTLATSGWSGQCWSKKPGPKYMEATPCQKAASMTGSSASSLISPIGLSTPSPWKTMQRRQHCSTTCSSSTLSRGTCSFRQLAKSTVECTIIRFSGHTAKTVRIWCGCGIHGAYRDSTTRRQLCQRSLTS